MMLEDYCIAFWMLRSASCHAMHPVLEEDDFEKMVALVDTVGFVFADVGDLKQDVMAACIV